MAETFHSYKTRVYYDDTDASGYVYHSNYLRMAERARTTMLHHKGITHNMLKVKNNAGFVVRTAEVDYKIPAKLDDLVDIKTKVLEVKGASVKVLQEIWKDDQQLVKITLKLAVVDASGKPIRVPETIRTAFKNS